jgi:hypothetical protein
MRALAFAADVGEQARASRGESGLGAHRPVQSRSARQVRASIPAACLHKDHWEWIGQWIGHCDRLCDRRHGC